MSWASGWWEFHPHIAKCAFLRLELMNHLSTTNGKTMSSRDIADLVESRHDDVKRSIVRLANKGVIQLPPLAEVKNQQGQTVAEYQIGKRDSYVIVAQLSPEFTARLVDRWQELEGQPLPVSALSRMDILKLAMESEERAIAAEASLAIAAPKADAFERIADSSGSMTIREAAKDLGLPPGVLGDWLKANRWIYKQGKANLAFEPRITSGLMEHKVTVLELEDEDGTPRTKSVSQPRITPKGLAKLALEVPGARS